MRSVLAEGTSLKSVAGHILASIGELHTKYGRFRKALEKGTMAQSSPVGRDLLPVSLDGVERLAEFNDPEVQRWTVLICWSLNFHYCIGWEKATHLEHSRELSPSQRAMVVGHIKPAVERMLVGDPSLPSGYGYDVSTWVVMEQIEAEKVMEPHEWPDRVPQSYVRATDEEWEKVVKAGYALGLFQHCPDREVLRSPSGERILNGAGAVPKMKKGKRQQRFISILCPLNAVSRKIEGDEGTLPYVGQVGLCLVPQDGVIVIDSEDLQSAQSLRDAERVARYVRLPNTCAWLSAGVG